MEISQLKYSDGSELYGGVSGIEYSVKDLKISLPYPDGVPVKDFNAELLKSTLDKIYINS